MGCTVRFLDGFMRLLKYAKRYELGLSMPNDEVGERCWFRKFLAQRWDVCRKTGNNYQEFKGGG